MCQLRYVVICLKSCIFVVSITTDKRYSNANACCDLLKKLYLCGVNYNHRLNIKITINVVICLKSCIFVVSITTDKRYSNEYACCDLLKKLYLCGVNYNEASFAVNNIIVVICLKSCIFVVSITTVRTTVVYHFRCDLLKKLYLCGVNYNWCC